MQKNAMKELLKQYAEMGKFIRVAKYTTILLEI